MYEPETLSCSFESSATPFMVDYAAAADLPRPGNDTQQILAAIHFSPDGEQPPNLPDHSISVCARPLGEFDTEIWRSPQPVSQGCEQQIVFRHNEEVLVGCLREPELDCADLEAAAFRAYQQLYNFTRESGYTYPLRTWNWFPAINRIDGELERYRSFCVGRHRALEATATKHLSAASAIGTQAGDLLIYFLAARAPGKQVENPRQVSAFRYPARYSPKSPSFSRAVVKRWNECAHLYISGTASIVGHESQHTDTLAQLDESLLNLNALIRQADRQHGIGIDSVAQLSRLRVYLRHIEDQAAVQQHLTTILGDRNPTLLLMGDICRSDLRLEIEGFYAGDQ